MAVDDTGADNGRDSNAVGNLAHQGACGREGRGMHVCANVEVNHNGGGQVEGDLEALEHEQGLLEILGRFHLGNQTEESDVGTVSEDDVGNRLECSVKVGLDGGVDDTTGVTFDTHGNHSDHDSARDAEE